MPWWVRERRKPREPPARRRGASVWRGRANVAYGVDRASDAVTCQCIGYFDRFPLLSLLVRALKTDSITLPKPRRILSML
jgi:hypothetical protein